MPRQPGRVHVSVTGATGPETGIFGLSARFSVPLIHKKERRPENKANNFTVSKNASNSFMSLFKTLLDTLWGIFCSLLVIAGFAGVMYFTGAKELALWASAKSWEETKCEIKLATMDRQEHKKVDSTFVKKSFRTVTKYDYVIDEGSFKGNRYNFERFRSPYKTVKTDFDYLTSAKKLPCYYNPRQPEQSVIDRSFRTTFAWLLVPLLSIGPFAYMALEYLYKLTFGNLLRLARQQRKPGLA